MCSTCDQKAVNVLKVDFYSQMQTQRSEILQGEDMEAVFGQAFEELIQNYAQFVEKVFQGHYDAESIERRQRQWEERFASLVAQVEHGEAPTEEEDEKGEPTQGLVMPTVSLSHPEEQKKSIWSAIGNNNT